MYNVIKKEHLSASEECLLKMQQSSIQTSTSQGGARTRTNTNTSQGGTRTRTNTNTSQGGTTTQVTTARTIGHFFRQRKRTASTTTLKRDQDEEMGLEEAVEELKLLKTQPFDLERRKLRRNELMDIIKKRTSPLSAEKIIEGATKSLTNAATSSWKLLDKIYEEIDITGKVKRRVEAQSGASVAAVFDLSNDMIRLNLLMGLTLLFAVVLPSVIWEDEEPKMYGQTVSFTNLPITSTLPSTYVDIPQLDNEDSVDSIDQYWGWTTEKYNTSSEIYDCAYVDLTSDNLVVHECSYTYIRNHSASMTSRTFFTDVLDFLKGTGFLERTALFIGWYPAYLTNSSDSYSINFAYVLVMIFVYGVSIFYVVRAYARWLRYKPNFFNYDYIFSNLILKGWDFNITNSSAASTEKKLLVMELLAIQTEVKFMEEKGRRTISEKRKLFVIRFFVALITICMIFGGWVSIYFVVTRVKGDSFFKQYAATMTVSLFNNVYPPIFFALSLLEKYRSQTELLVYIMRSICLRLVSIVIMATSEITNKLQDIDDESPCHIDNLCWETRLAQRIYSLLVFETLFHIPVTIFVVFRYFLGKLPEDFFLAELLPNVIWNFLSNPEFDTANNVIKTVYLQTLCWMGVICTPLLPLVTVLSFLFIVNTNGAVLFLCKLKPATAFRASRSSSMFTFALLVGLILSLFPSLLLLSYLEPSPGCTPFRGLGIPYEAVVFTICSAPVWLSSFLFFLGGGIFKAIIMLCLFLSLVYYLALAKARKRKIKYYEKKLQITSQYNRALRKRVFPPREKGLQSNTATNTGVSYESNPRQTSSITTSCSSPQERYHDKNYTSFKNQSRNMLTGNAASQIGRYGQNEITQQNQSTSMFTGSNAASQVPRYGQNNTVQNHSKGMLIGEPGSQIGRHGLHNQSRIMLNNSEANTTTRRNIMPSQSYWENRHRPQNQNVKSDSSFTYAV